MPVIDSPGEDWLKRLANKERDRRSKIISFEALLPAFSHILGAHLQADADEYQKEFPGETVIVEYDEKTAQFSIVCSGYKPPPRATVKINPIKQHIVCSFDDAGNNPGWEETLQVSDLGLHLKGCDLNSTARDLSKKILTTVLFPAL